MMNKKRNQIEKRNLDMVKILGSSSHSSDERETLDFYATDPDSLVLFLDRIQKDSIKLDTNIWEIACGDGAISNVLKARGYNVFSTDIVNRRDSCDALFDMSKDDTLLKFYGDILTNPPYSLVETFVRKSLGMVWDRARVVMYLRLQFLEGKKRKKLFDDFPPKYVYVHSSRQSTYKNNEKEQNKKKASAICFAWFIWEKGFQGDPVIRWI